MPASPFRNLTILAELHEIGAAYGATPAQQCGITDPHAAYCLNSVARLAGLHVARERQIEAEDALLDASGRPIDLGTAGGHRLGPLTFPRGGVRALPEANEDQDVDLKGLL